MVNIGRMYSERTLSYQIFATGLVLSCYLLVLVYVLVRHYQKRDWNEKIEKNMEPLQLPTFQQEEPLYNLRKQKGFAPYIPGRLCEFMVIAAIPGFTLGNLISIFPAIMTHPGEINLLSIYLVLLITNLMAFVMSFAQQRYFPTLFLQPVALLEATHVSFFSEYESVSTLLSFLTQDGTTLSVKKVQVDEVNLRLVSLSYLTPFSDCLYASDPDTTSVRFFETFGTIRYCQDRRTGFFVPVHWNLLPETLHISYLRLAREKPDYKINPTAFPPGVCDDEGRFKGGLSRYEVQMMKFLCGPKHAFGAPETLFQLVKKDFIRLQVVWQVFCCFWLHIANSNKQGFFWIAMFFVYVIHRIYQISRDRQALLPKVPEPSYNNVFRGGQLVVLEAGQVVCGDLIKLEAGDKLPATALMLAGSAVTSQFETSPINKYPSTFDKDELPTQLLAGKISEIERFVDSHLLMDESVVVQTVNNHLIPADEIGHSAFGVIVGSAPMCQDLMSGPLDQSSSRYLMDKAMLLCYIVCGLLLFLIYYFQTYGDIKKWYSWELYTTLFVDLLAEIMSPVWLIGFGIIYSTAANRIKSKWGCSGMSVTGLHDIGSTRHFVFDKGTALLSEEFKPTDLKLVLRNSNEFDPSRYEILDGQLLRRDLQEFEYSDEIVTAMGVCHNLAVGTAGLLGSSFHLALFELVKAEFSQGDPSTIEVQGKVFQVLRRLDLNLQDQHFQGVIIRRVDIPEDFARLYLKMPPESCKHLKTLRLPSDFNEMTAVYRRESATLFTYLVAEIYPREADSRVNPRHTWDFIMRLPHKKVLKNRFRLLGLVLLKNYLAPMAVECIQSLQNAGLSIQIISSDDTASAVDVANRVGLVDLPEVLAEERDLINAEMLDLFEDEEENPLLPSSESEKLNGPEALIGRLESYRYDEDSRITWWSLVNGRNLDHESVIAAASTFKLALTYQAFEVLHKTGEIKKIWNSIVVVGNMTPAGKMRYMNYFRDIIRVSGDRRGGGLVNILSQSLTTRRNTFHIQRFDLRFLTDVLAEGRGVHFRVETMVFAYTMYLCSLIFLKHLFVSETQSLTSDATRYFGVLVAGILVPICIASQAPNPHPDPVLSGLHYLDTLQRFTHLGCFLLVMFGFISITSSSYAVQDFYLPWSSKDLIGLARQQGDDARFRDDELKIVSYPGAFHMDNFAHSKHVYLTIAAILSSSTASLFVSNQARMVLRNFWLLWVLLLTFAFFVFLFFWGPTKWHCIMGVQCATHTINDPGGSVFWAFKTGMSLLQLQKKDNQTVRPCMMGPQVFWRDTETQNFVYGQWPHQFVMHCLTIQRDNMMHLHEKRDWAASAQVINAVQADWNLGECDAPHNCITSEYAWVLLRNLLLLLVVQAGLYRLIALFYLKVRELKRKFFS